MSIQNQQLVRFCMRDKDYWLNEYTKLGISWIFLYKISTVNINFGGIVPFKNNNKIAHFDIVVFLKCDI